MADAKRRTEADADVPQPDIIEHFTNADANVRQLPERFLSRKT